MLNDPHMRARGNIVETTSARGEPLTMPGVIPHFTRNPGAVRWSGENIGASNREVYQGLLGLDDGEFRRLIDAKVI